MPTHKNLTVEQELYMIDNDISPTAGQEYGLFLKSKEFHGKQCKVDNFDLVTTGGQLFSMLH